MAFPDTIRVRLPKDASCSQEKQQQEIEAIRQALPQIDSLEELCKRTQLKPRILWNYCREYGLKLPASLKPWKQRPEIDLLIERGLRQREIAEKVELSRELIRIYINYSGQYPLWKKARIELKEQAHQRKYHLEQIAAQIKQRVKQLAERDGWASQKAMEFMSARKVTRYSLSQLVTLFQRYEKACQEEEKLSLKELGQDLGISFAEVGIVLKTVGVEPMYGARERETIPPEKKEAIYRAAAIDMSIPDLAYFLDLPDYVVGQNLRRIRAERKRKAVIKSYGSGTKLSYRLASQIYQAVDLEFKPQETRQLLDTSSKVIEYVLSNRRPIETEIKKALSLLYPALKIKKPYL